MRYDDLMILEGMFIDVTREDVKDVIRAELGENISYCIEAFDFDEQIISLKKDETDESYEIVPIKISGSTIGINIKRVKKKVNGEKFSLSKNIVYRGKENKGITVSTLEKVETKDYTIFFENTKNIIKQKQEDEDYIKDQESLGLWVYDNKILKGENYNYSGIFEDTTCYGQFDYHKRLSYIEKTINKDYLLPDYIAKIETELNEHEKMVGTIYTNYLETTEYKNEDMFYFDHSKCKRDIYSDMEKYVEDMKELLSLETSFDGAEKRIYDLLQLIKDRCPLLEDNPLASSILHNLLKNYYSCEIKKVDEYGIDLSGDIFIRVVNNDIFIDIPKEDSLEGESFKLTIPLHDKFDRFSLSYYNYFKKDKYYHAIQSFRMSFTMGEVTLADIGEWLYREDVPRISEDIDSTLLALHDLNQDFYKSIRSLIVNKKCNEIPPRYSYKELNLDKHLNYVTFDINKTVSEEKFDGNIFNLICRFNNISTYDYDNDSKNKMINALIKINNVLESEKEYAPKEKQYILLNNRK